MASFLSFSLRDASRFCRLVGQWRLQVTNYGSEGERSSSDLSTPHFALIFAPSLAQIQATWCVYAGFQSSASYPARTPVARGPNLLAREILATAPDEPPATMRPIDSVLRPMTGHARLVCTLACPLDGYNRPRARDWPHGVVPDRRVADHVHGRIARHQGPPGEPMTRSAFFKMGRISSRIESRRTCFGTFTSRAPRR